jgi:hypothetical protein
LSFSSRSLTGAAPCRNGGCLADCAMRVALL